MLPPHPPPVADSGRVALGLRWLAALDGLRGAAALVVVFHHLLLTHPRLADGYGPYAGDHQAGLAWWLLYTPLHLLWAGQEAVLIFFVLSGLVLARAATAARDNRRWWARYYPRRIARLYIPVWASSLVTVALVSSFPTRSNPLNSSWVNSHAGSLGPVAMLNDLALLNLPGQMNSVLWSLKWEVLFSLLLPFFAALLALRFGLGWKLLPVLGCTLVGALGMTSLGSGPALFFMSAFLLGMLLHQPSRALDELRLRMNRHFSLGLGLLVGSLLLLVAHWLPGPHHAPFGVPAGELGGALRAGQVVGAAGLVFVSAAWAPLGRVLAASPMQWLGRRSFSLYLVHEPIVVAAVAITGHPLGGPATLLTLAVTLVVAEIFYLVIERPSTDFARRLGEPASRVPSGQAAPA